MKAFVRLCLAITCFIAVSATAFAQGAIGGIVRDTSGGVLPGVTVEAQSPALIEGVRTAVTDSGGQYLITELRPGTYSVTFTLPGFSVLRREGLVLTSGVTLPINAQMSVGTIEETVTVTGATPVVDVQSTQRRTVLDRDVLESIPRTRNQQFTGSLLPGVVSNAVQDLGGSSGFPVTRLGVHGGDDTDQAWSIGGFQISEGGTGAQRMHVTADLTAQEYTYETSGISAEWVTGGVVSNLIPKEGGNVFSGTTYGVRTSEGMTTDNLNDELRSLGFTRSSKILNIWDYSGSVGGPIQTGRLWFFFTGRRYGNEKHPVGAIFESDPARLATTPQVFSDVNGRLTWQATPKNKLSIYFDRSTWDIATLRLSSTTTAEASDRLYGPQMHLSQGSWTAPVSTRLLLEAGGSYYYQTQNWGPSEFARPGLPRHELTTGVRSNRGGTRHTTEANNLTVKASASYVTGTHALKAGFSHRGGIWFREQNQPSTLRLVNGRPFQVLLQPTPIAARPRVNHDLGIYAQDQWRMAERVTLNLGLRFDWLNEQNDASCVPAGQWVPARCFDEQSNVANWKDISPRLGVVWDVFGTGKTAIKSTLSRYLNSDWGGFANSVNPANALATDLRIWNDLNGDLVPQLEELGPSTNRLFGTSVLSTHVDPALTDGWGVRYYNWEFSASVDHELTPGLSVTAGYFRRSFGNQIWVNNRAISPDDFTSFTISSPLNSEQITLYNLDPALRGVTDLWVEVAPDDSRVFDGVDLHMNGRFGQGGTVNGGISMGRTSRNFCTVWDPNDLRFCEVTPPFFSQNQYKAMVAYPLPFDIQISGVFQSMPYNTGGGGVGSLSRGNSFDATPFVRGIYTVTSAIAGIPLTQGSINVDVAEPRSVYGDRLNRVDLRLTKLASFGQVRAKAYIDFFNVLNAAPILGYNTTFGPRWQSPTNVLDGRVIQVGAQLDF